MSDAIANTRALLRLFSQSDYGELYVRGDDYSLFIARTAGRTNPLLKGAVAAPETVAATPSFLVTAPHIASLLSTLPLGSAVSAGDIVARVALLDEEIDIVAEKGGTVDALLAQPGALIEYAAPILSLAAA